MNRFRSFGTVLGRTEVAEGIFLLKMECPEIAASALPGQFVNIKARDIQWGPFLRRPFSISSVNDGTIDFLFNVIGSGTRLLASRSTGEKLDLLGPLGRPFGFDEHFDTAVMVAGGLGFAPFPFLDQEVRRSGRQTILFAGARTASHLYVGPLEDAHVATDDGTKGYHGTVVALLQQALSRRPISRPKIFGCGPNRMLKALSEAALVLGIPCELSLEGDMACGIGICQGCPVETVGRDRKYALVCADGPTFDCREVIL